MSERRRSKAQSVWFSKRQVTKATERQSDTRTSNTRTHVHPGLVRLHLGEVGLVRLCLVVVGVVVHPVHQRRSERPASEHRNTRSEGRTKANRGGREKGKRRAGAETRGRGVGRLNLPRANQRALPITRGNIPIRRADPGHTQTRADCAVPERRKVHVSKL